MEIFSTVWHVWGWQNPPSTKVESGTGRTLSKWNQDPRHHPRPSSHYHNGFSRYGSSVGKPDLQYTCEIPYGLLRRIVNIVRERSMVRWVYISFQNRFIDQLYGRLEWRLEVKWQVHQYSIGTSDDGNHELWEEYCPSKRHHNPCQLGKFWRHVALSYRMTVSQGQI